ncbi:MAG: hypothetical protein ABSG25_02500 [Bryobacteraceae bacterium]
MKNRAHGFVFTLLAFAVLTSSAALAATAPRCGNYQVAPDGRCFLQVWFPWVAVQDATATGSPSAGGWKSWIELTNPSADNIQVSLNATLTDTTNAGASFTIRGNQNNPLTNGAASAIVLNGPYGFDFPPGGILDIRLFSAGGVDQFNTPSSDLLDGPATLTFYSADPAALDAQGAAQISFLYYPVFTGTGPPPLVVSPIWQCTSTGVRQDQAVNGIYSMVTIALHPNGASNPLTDENSTFAVVNISQSQQTVTISLADDSGMPVPQAASIQQAIAPGASYANTVGNFFSAYLNSLPADTPSPSARKIMFQSNDKIAVVVLRVVGNAGTALPIWPLP